MLNIKALALMVWDKKIFKVFFFFQLPWQPEIFTEFKSLKYSESASPKDHFCDVLLKSVGRFQLFTDGRTYGRTYGRTDAGQ